MSTTVSVTINLQCDQRCHQAAQFTGSSLHDAAAKATKAGWVCRSNYAACPNHNVLITSSAKESDHAQKA